jgi:hypothetical protein
MAAAIPEPLLSRRPMIFASILESAFPFRRPVVEPAPVPDVEPMENMDEVISFGGRNIPRWLVNTITNAAKATGVDPTYMLTLADVESSLTPNAKAPTSSAQGLFQFIDRTWLETVQKHAADYGYAGVAAAVKMVNGEPSIVDESQRSWVLGMRRDPYFSALMAGELIKDVERALQTDGERELAETELYLAHFFGATSAARFLKALDEQPDTAASKLFPEAAKANAGLFQERSGKKRRSVSVAELYDKIDTKIVKRLNRYDDIAPLVAGSPTRVSVRTVEANAVR